MIPSDPPIPKFKWPRAWWMWLMDMWEWLRSKQPVPDKNDFLVLEKPTGTYFSISQAAFDNLAQNAVHPLKLVDISSGGVAKVRVLYGQIAGRAADSSMTSAGFDVTLTANGVRYIYCEITRSYTAPLWSDSACEIKEAASVPAATATQQFEEIGHVERESDGSGGYRVKAGSIHQELGYNARIARLGDASTYDDYIWSLR